MAKNMTQIDGRTIQYTNGTGNDKVSGDPVLQGVVVCVLINDCDDGDTESAYTEGVANLAASGTIGSRGIKLYLDTDNDVVTPTAGAFKYAGTSWSAKSDGKVDVKLPGIGDMS